MIDPNHLLRYVIRPVLESLGLHSVAAERLVLGTACQESECGRWLVQVGGPALGIYQMEPATYDSLWLDFLAYQPRLAPKVKQFCSGLVLNSSREMIWNLAYATAMCRVHYYRDPQLIPTDLPGQAEYYKRVYNTAAGAATPEQYRKNWQRFVGTQWA